MNTIELLTINSIFFISYKLFSSYFNKNISEERIKWREKIREITIKIVTMDKENAEKNKDEFIAELAIRLNLFDDNSDLKIIEIAKKVLENIDKEEYKNEFIARISILLKNDWERSKCESSIKSIFGLGKPKQINIENPIEFYKENRNKNNSVFNSEDLKTNFNLYKKEYKYQESCITPIFFWGYLVFTIFYIIKELLCLTIK